jgi:hypothetical protein
MEAVLDESAARRADSCFGIEASVSRALRAAKARTYTERTVLCVAVSKVDVNKLE